MHESRGAQIVDLEDLRYASAVITESDGSVYMRLECAAAIYKAAHVSKNIYVVAAESHSKQWKQVLYFGDMHGRIVIVPFGLISLEEGTMSTQGK